MKVRPPESTRKHPIGLHNKKHYTKTEKWRWSWWISQITIKIWIWRSLIKL